LQHFGENSKRPRVVCNCCAPMFRESRVDSGLRSLARKLRQEREANMSTKLIARRRLVALGRIYNAGAVVPENVVRANRRVLLRTHYLEEVPESQPTLVQPVDLPPPAPPPAKRPKLKIIRLSNPIDAWHETFREARKHFSNDADCTDFLMSFPEVRELNKSATALAVAQEKAKHKGAMQSVTPDMVGF
jgi:hypothetical protein